MGDPGAQIAPGWYEQAGRPGVLVYFDGQAWTAHTRPKPEPDAAPPVRHPAAVVAPPAAAPVAAPPVVPAPTPAAPPGVGPDVLPTGPTMSWQPQALPPEQLGPQDGGMPPTAPGATSPAAWAAPTSAPPGLPTMHDPLYGTSTYGEPPSRFGTPPGPSPFGGPPQTTRFGTPPGPSPFGGPPQTTRFGTPPGPLGPGGSPGGPVAALPPNGGPYAPPTTATGDGAPQGPLVPVGAAVTGWQDQPPPSGAPLPLPPLWSGRPGAALPTYGETRWAPTPTYAHWGWRVLSHTVDNLVVSIPVWLISFAVALSWATSHPGARLSDQQSLRLELPGYAVGLIIWFVNRCVIAGRTGRSLGRVVTGTRLVRESTGRPLGVWLAFIREIADILNVLPLYLGYLWPLWDAKRQTFSDKAVGSLVLR